jgi:site-specific recombinase XerD
MKLLELFEIYTAKRLRGCSPNTLRLYRHSIAAYEKTLGRDATLEDLTDDNLHRHMWRLVDEGRSKATANKDCAQIGAMWRFANRNGLVTNWPNVKLLNEPERVPMGWLSHEIDALYASIEREPGYVLGIPARLWWKCLVSVLLETGERIGPMRKLARTAISGQFLLVPAEFRKRGTRDKLYKLTAKTAQELIELIGYHKDEKLFPWDRTETYVYKRYCDILKRAGLSHDDKSKFHKLRKTCCSIVKLMGGDPTSAMDHASTRTTKRYLDPRIVGETPTSDYIDRYRKGG